MQNISLYLKFFLDKRVRLDSRQSEVMKSYNNILFVQNLSMTRHFFSFGIYQQKFDHKLCIL